MISEKHTPTPLIQDRDRVTVRIVAVEEPSRFWFVSQMWALTVWVVSVCFRHYVLRRKFTPREIGRSAREFVEKLGGLWIKAGQLISLRRDAFPPEFCAELSNLQDKANGYHLDDMRAMIEEELGGPIDRFFMEFDEHPFAAASIGQTHRARLKRSGDEVAVKLQRPFVQEKLRQNMVVIGWLLRFVNCFRSFKHLRLIEMLSELENIMVEEVDYRIEATNIRRMRRNLRPHRIKVPKVFSRYSSRRVLALEFVHGVMMSDYIAVQNDNPTAHQRWLDENKVKPTKVARTLFLSLMRQMFEDNLFHGDLHPGNIMLLRNSRVALIDFGTIGSMEQEYLERYRVFNKALAMKEYSKAVDLMFLLSSSLPIIDVDKAKEKMVRVLRQWEAKTHTKDLPYDQKSMSAAMQGLVQVLIQHRITTDWQFLRVDRANLTLDASLRYLAPRVNYSKLIERYFDEAVGRAGEQESGLRKLKIAMGNVTGLLESAGELAEDVQVYVAPRLRRQAQIYEMNATKFEKLFSVIFRQGAIGLFCATAFTVLAFLCRFYRDLVIAVSGHTFMPIDRLLPDLPYFSWVIVMAIQFHFILTGIKLGKTFKHEDHRTHRR